MPLTARRQTPKGQQSIIKEFGAEPDFNSALDLLVVNSCNKVLELDMRIGTNSAVEPTLTFDNLPKDICIGITLWVGTSWPEGKIITQGDEGRIRHLVQEGVNDWFDDVEDPPTVDVETMVFT